MVPGEGVLSRTKGFSVKSWVRSGVCLESAGADGEIAVVVLDRPAVHNAIDGEMLAALGTALEEIDAQPAVRAAVITGAGGRAFSSGMDLQERAGFSDAALRAQRAGIVGVMARLNELRVPAIAAVEGWALAGGFELALACDLVVASSSATFGLPEVGVGVMPGGGATATLTWAVGAARARDLILTGRRLTAEEAASWGIVSRVVGPGHALEVALGLATVIADAAPLGVRGARAGVRAAHGSLRDAMAAEDAAYETVLVSEDRREGFRAFVEKRRPRFDGR